MSMQHILWHGEPLHVLIPLQSNSAQSLISEMVQHKHNESARTEDDLVHTVMRLLYPAGKSSGTAGLASSCTTAKKTCPTVILSHGIVEVVISHMSMPNE